MGSEGYIERILDKFQIKFPSSIWTDIKVEYPMCTQAYTFEVDNQDKKFNRRRKIFNTINLTKLN